MQSDIHERKVLKMQADHHQKVTTDEEKYRQLMKDKDQQRKNFEIDIKNTIVEQELLANQACIDREMEKK